MPTDSERREAAARLRCMAVGANPSWPRLFESLKTPGRAVTVLYLADLIEPEPERTCRMLDNGVELCCSVCDRRHGYDDEPDFCMGCGAKVVSE